MPMTRTPYPPEFREQMVALDDIITEVCRHYHVPASNTATGLIVFENDAERAGLARVS